jgi:hypothetical protein
VVARSVSFEQSTEPKSFTTEPQKQVGLTTRRTAYEWAEFLGFSVDCSKLTDLATTVPFYEATLGTGPPGGTLSEIPAQTAHLYLLLATCAEGAVPVVKNGWQFVRSWVNNSIRADIYFKKMSCLVALAPITAVGSEPFLYSDVSAVYVGNGFFMPKSLKIHYDYIRAGILVDCSTKRTIAVGRSGGGGLAQIARAYSDVEESWAFNSIKTIINGHGPSQSVLPHSIHTYSHLAEPDYEASDHIAQLPMDQPYLIYTQGANNFELREEKHSLGAMDEVTHSQARVAQDEPKALQVLMYDNLQNYTVFNDNTMERMLLQEAVRRVHLPYISLEILESLYGARM